MRLRRQFQRAFGACGPRRFVGRFKPEWSLALTSFYSPNIDFATFRYQNTWPFAFQKIGSRPLWQLGRTRPPLCVCCRRLLSHVVYRTREKKSTRQTATARSPSMSGRWNLSEGYLDQGSCAAMQEGSWVSLRRPDHVKAESVCIFKIPNFLTHWRPLGCLFYSRPFVEQHLPASRRRPSVVSDENSVGKNGSITDIH